jgi:hypothetical protein
MLHNDLNEDCFSKNALSPFSTPLCLFSRKSQILLLLSYLFIPFKERKRRTPLGGECVQSFL